MHTINYHYLDLTANSCVLDLGCGEGRHSLGLPELADGLAVGVDLSFGDLQSAQRKTAEHQQFVSQHQLPTNAHPNWLNASALQLPFADASFDVVICSEVLEHIPDYQQALAEITRVLKPEGQLAISVPRQWPERLCWSFCDEYSQTPGGHVRIFNANKLRREIRQLGFYSHGQHYAHALHSPYWWLKCLLWHKPEHALLRAYHRLLVWDLLKTPRITRILEQVLNPLMGKSVVMYFAKLGAEKP